MKKVEKDARTFLEKWVQRTVRQYVSKLDGHDNGHLHDLILSGIEKPLLQMVLDETGGNQTKASQILGINRNTLRKKIQDYNIRCKPDN